MTDDISVRSGIDSFLIYEEEATYKTKPASITKAFGLVTSFNPTVRRNVSRRKGTRNTLPAAATEASARDAFKLLKGLKEGEITIEAEPLDFNHLNLVMGSSSGSGTTVAPYWYPQESASTDADKLKYNRQPSFSISTNYHFDGSGDNASTAIDLLGNKVSNYTIRAQSGEPVTFTLATVFAGATKNALETGVALSSVDPYYFVEADLESPTGTSVSNIIDNFELQIATGTTLRHGLGSDEAQKATVGGRDFTLTVTMDAEGTEFWDDVIASDVPTIASMTFKFERSDGTYLECIMLDVKPDEESLQNTYPDPVQENITWIPRIVYFKEVDTAP